MRRGFDALLLLALAAGGVAVAGEVAHTVRPGESVSAIAKRYYDDFDQAEFLLRFNGRDGLVIHPGEILRIPYSEAHTVRGGDNWSALADRYLGRTSAWPAIPVLNDRAPEAPLRPGQRVRLPVLLRYELRRGDTLALLGQRFYADPARGRLIQEINGIEDARRLSVGQVLELPLLAPALHRPPAEPADVPAPAAAARPEPEPPQVPEEPVETTEPAVAETRFTTELDRARRAFDNGEFASARQQLEGLRAQVTAEGGTADRVTLWRLLGFVYVAFDLEEPACESFHQLATLDAEPTLDPDLVSPKIRERLEACGS